ncbi:MAG: tetratricopeptide repeat protein, partial [Limisphaerales bacterium]
AVRLMPENPEAIFNYGIACARYGDYKNALNYLEKATVLMPQNPQLFYNLGLVCMKVGLKEKAIDAFSKVLNIEPNNEAAQKQLSKLKNSQ